MIEVRKIDYNNQADAAHLCELLDQYAMDPMGGGKSIEPSILETLPGKLAKFPTAFSLIAYVDDQPAALANCFFGFSTFSAKRLINIHDLVVLSSFRGRGLCRKLLEHVEQIAKAENCCKLTLEVLDKNEVAKAAYRNFGFEGYELNAEAGQAVFWQKPVA